MGEAYYYVLCPALMYFKELSVIDDASDDLIHVVCLVRIVRDDVVESVVNSSCRVRCFNEWSFLAVV